MKKDLVISDNKSEVTIPEKKKETASKFPFKGKVKRGANLLRLRKTPDLNSPILFYIPENTEVIVKREEGAWYFVEVVEDDQARPKKGYVKAEYIVAK